MLRVLFCSVKYEYGNKDAGISFVYTNFFDALSRMSGVEARFFGIDERMMAVGRDEMNRELVDTVHEFKPDLLFCMLFTEEVKKETIDYITKHTKTKTLNWFADDHWRFHVFSKKWAHLFTAVATTDSRAPEKYRAIGIRNVIKTQWAANQHLYFPKSGLPAVTAGSPDVVFVGQKYGNRGAYIRKISQMSGAVVSAYGSGWGSGRIDFETMVSLFATVPIVLNFTESPYVGLRSFLKSFVKLFIKKELGKYVFDGDNIINNFLSSLSLYRRQIKARVFEVPACGGFLLTGDADNLSDYFCIGKEIETFSCYDELLEKVVYYKEHKDAREAIAESGYRRVLSEHTYDHRFREIFRALELE